MNILDMQKIVDFLLDGTDIESNIAISLDYPDKILTTLFREKGRSKSSVDLLVAFNISREEYTAKIKLALKRFMGGAEKMVDDAVNSMFGGIPSFGGQKYLE